MNIEEFISKTTYKYQPVFLKETKTNGIVKKEFIRNQTAKCNDTKTIPENTFKLRQEVESDHIAIHLTDKLAVIDVDYTDDYQPNPKASKWLDNMKQHYPWKPSTTKKKGLHIYFKPDGELYELLQSKSRHIHTPFKHIEILASGSWAFEKRNSIISNPDNGIPSLSKLPVIKLNTFKVQSIQSIPVDIISNYTSWVKMISSIKSLGDDYFDIADEISKKTNKNNYGGVLECWKKAVPQPFTYITDILKKLKKSVKHDLIETIYQSIKDKVVVNTVNGKDSLFVYHNDKWLEDGSSRRYFHSLITKTVEQDIEVDEDNEDLLLISSKYVELKNIGDLVLNKLYKTYKQNIEFDNIDYLYHFKNITLDLRTLTFRKRQRTDYATIEASYLNHLSLDKEGCLNFTDDILNSIEMWDTIFKDILTNQQVRQTYIEILCNSFSGKVLPKFVVANGCGSNGKSFLHSCVMMVHNKYAYRGSTSTLTNPICGNANPTVANHHRKRFSLMAEPNENDKILFATVKSLTGDRCINARGLYSSNTETVMAGIKIVECNKRLELDGITDYSMTRRLVDVLFKTCFKPKDELKHHVGNDDDIITYKTANLEYLTEEWREKHSSGLFYYLFKYMVDNRKTFYNLDEVFIADSIKQRSLNYITQQNQLLQVIESFCVEKVGGVVSITDLANSIKNNQEFYNLLTKRERKEMTTRALTKRIKEDPQLQNKFISKRKMINGKSYNNALYGYSLIEKQNNLIID